MDISIPQRSTVSEELRAEVDGQILKHQEAIRSLRERRNILAPISRLPPELLSRIFLYARDTTDGTAKVLPPASHVCRAWRAVAIACGLLWTEIECDRLSWAKEMILRSRGAPLVLQVSNINRVVSDSRLREAIRLALDAASNAKALSISYGCLLPHQDGQECLGWPDSCPLLETLDITGSSDQPYDLPDALVFGSFPRLRQVSLKHCALTWNSTGVFRGLQNLRIQHFRDSQFLVPDLSKVLDVLRDMQSLQSLVISLEWNGLYNLPQEAEILSPHIPGSLVMVDLPQLAVLELGLNDLILVALLSHISHPQERLKIACAPPTTTRASAVMHCIQNFRQFQRENGHQIDAAYLFLEYALLLEASDLSREEEHPALQLRMYIPYTDHRKAIIEVVCAELPLSDMREVMVASMCDFKMIRPYLDQCKTLCLSGWTVAVREDFLDRQSFIEDGTRWLPVLDTLMLHMMDMTKLPKTSKKPDRMTLPGFFGQLGDICPFITQLKIFDCTINAPEKLDVFQHQVQHFERRFQPTHLFLRSGNHIPLMRRLFGYTAE